MALVAVQAAPSLTDYQVLQIIHLPHIGTNYEGGIRGRKVAIVGYSHYYDALEQDSDNFTRECIQKTIDGIWKPRFFTSVRNSFGFSNDSEFWNSVIFFNYVPMMIGTRNEKFYRMDAQQNDLANERFTKILGEYRPDVVFVFTSKTALHSMGKDFLPFGSSNPKFRKFDHVTTSGKSEIYVLRHTQGARTIDLRAAVSHGLANR